MLNFKSLVSARIRIEFTYYEMVADLDHFISFWGGEGNVLYTVNNELRGLSFLGLLWGGVRL